MNLQLLTLDTLRPSPLNPRKHFDPVKLDELAASFGGRPEGIIEPLVVRAVNGHHEIIAGERRYRAAQIAGLTHVPTLVRELTDAQVLEIMVIENNQRDDLNALEEGDGFKRLISTGYDIDRLAERIGHPRRYIFDRIKLLDLVDAGKALLLDGRLPTTHAIIIARLTPDAQERVLDADGGGAFDDDHTLFEVEEDDAREEDPYVGKKPRSVRELEAWINTHVRFDASAPVSRELFPATTTMLAHASDAREKVISITHDHHIQPSAKDGNTQRIYTARSWKLADGSDGRDLFTQRKVHHATCDRSVTGVVVVGPGRGEAHRVCVHKECPVHWAAEKKARAQNADRSKSSADQWKKDQEKQKAEQAKAEARREAWRKAKPAIRAACAERVKKAKISTIREYLSGRIEFYEDAVKVLGTPKTADALLEVITLAELMDASDSEWWAPERFPQIAKLFGVDVPAILKAQGTAAPATKKARK